MAILETYKLTKTYGDWTGVEDINLEVEEGAFYGILGPENAGKTTLARLILNLVRPTSGGVAVFDTDVRRDDGKLRRLIGYVPATDAFALDVTVRKYLKLQQRAYGLTDDSEILDVCQTVNLEPKARLRDMTADERKRLSIAAAILHKPKLLLLDEPSLDLDSYERSGVFKILRDLNDQGVTILFTTRSAEEVRRFCTHAAVMSEGHFLTSGKVEEIAALSTLKVTVRVEQDSYDFARALHIRSFSTSGDLISFLYEDSVDRLIKDLAEFTVHSFSIHESTLDTVLYSLRERSEQGDL